MSQPVQDNFSRLTLAVQGMSCASCVNRVEQHLKQVPGVAEADVNLLAGRAEVTFDPEQAQESDLIESVKKAGYAAHIARPGEAFLVAGGDPLRTRLIVGTVVAPLFTGGMVAHLLGLAWRVPDEVALLLAALVQFYAGAGFYVGAWKTLKARSLGMDVLVALGSSVAFFYGAWLVLGPNPAGEAPEYYFEASALIITFVVIGKWLEARVKRQAAAAVHHLVTLQPQEVRRRNATGQTDMIPIGQIASGDIFDVWAGERVPLDGVLLDGQAAFDMALITGESVPRTLGKSDQVLAGALCLNGTVVVKARAGVGDTLLDRMADMVAHAQTTKTRIQRLADKVSAFFIQGVVALAVIAFLYAWFTTGHVAAGILPAVAVLVVACPCALGLAVPAVISVAIGQAARHGILIRDAEILERAGKVTTVIFDKTGTLTEGAPELAEITGFSALSSEDLLASAAALNAQITHPLATALRQAAAARGVVINPAPEAENVPGHGVRGALADGRKLACGNLSFMVELGVFLDDVAATAATWEQQGRSLVWVASLDGTPRLLGLLAFRDAVRPDAQATIASLARQNITTAMLSGDNRANVETVARSLGIAVAHGEALPQDKMQEVVKRQTWGETVAMVGDGMNDAPVLAQADLGIVVTHGVAAADAAAGVRLMQDDLRLIPALIDLARRARRTMILNLVWAFVFNALALPFAALGVLPPHYAAMAMAVSSIAVLLHALSLKGWHPKHG